MTWGTETHWVDYSPKNMGRDIVTAQCGQRVHITEFSDVPTCKRCVMVVEYVQGFRGQFAYLSNFYIEPDSTHVEGEYQSFKSTPPAIHLRRMSPKRAKILGRELTLRPDWEQVKIEFMYRLVLRKFKDHPTLLESLKRTGDLYLDEDNYWGDRFWGTVEGVGENHLGKILMRVRGELS